MSLEIYTAAMRRLLVACALGALAFAAGAETRPLRFVTTARQLGPVGYRDPVGAISPDGRWVAYSEGRRLRLRPIEGGPVLEFAPGEGQIRHLDWSSDSGSVLAEDLRAATRWWVYDAASRTRRALWEGRGTLRGRTIGGDVVTTSPNQLRQLVQSHDGARLAGVVSTGDGTELWTLLADGSDAVVRRSSSRLASPAWTWQGAVACLVTADGRSRLSLPCGDAPLAATASVHLYGPLAFAPDDRVLYAAAPNSRGTVDLVSLELASGTLTRLTTFERDAYGPSVSRSGELLFKVQDYRTFVATVSADGGATHPVATFQSETPSWDPTGAFLGVTYGTWRRLTDDANYPDIAQEVGVIALDESHAADHPTRAIATSISEDQSMCWSPNTKWIAFHSHKEQSDDIWLMPNRDGAADTRITFLGRGAETGWPRWSPDGTRLVFDAASRKDGRNAIYVMGLDQETGAVTREAAEVAVEGFSGEMSHAEWLPDSRTIVVHATSAPGEHLIMTVPSEGGSPRIVHRYKSEHDSPGLGVSRDGQWAAFVAPAPDGFLQVFRIPLAGGPPIQLTSDPTNKTQPAVSPEGRRVAFTVWSYEAQLWVR